MSARLLALLLTLALCRACAGTGKLGSWAALGCALVFLRALLSLCDALL